MDITHIEEIDFTKNNKFLIIGKRGSGKTTLCRRILNKLNPDLAKQDSAIFCNTGEIDSYLNHQIPIYADHDNFLLNFKTYFNETCGLHDVKKLIIIDDPIYNYKNLLENNEFLKIITDGKDLNYVLIMTMQYPINMNKAIRQEFNFIIVFNNSGNSYKKKIHEYYCPFIEDSNEFSNVYDSATHEQFAALVINQKNNEIFYNYDKPNVPLKIEIII